MAGAWRLIFFIVMMVLEGGGGVFALTMEEKMKADNYITCPGGTCVETPYGAQFAGKLFYGAPASGGNLGAMNGSIPPEIGDLVKLTFLYEFGSIHARGRCCRSMYDLLTLCHPFFRL